MHDVAAIVLAAGLSRRMGAENKLVMPQDLARVRTNLRIKRDITVRNPISHMVRCLKKRWFAPISKEQAERLASIKLPCC